MQSQLDVQEQEHLQLVHQVSMAAPTLRSTPVCLVRSSPLLVDRTLVHGSPDCRGSSRQPDGEDTILSAHLGQML